MTVASGDSGVELPGHILSATASRLGDKIALVTTGRSLTYAELDELSNRVATGLLVRGAGHGERVSIYAPNRWEWIVAYHGALKAGAVVNPINIMLTLEEVGFVLRDCAARVLFTSSDKASLVGENRADIDSLREIVALDEPVPGASTFDEYLKEPAPAGFRPVTTDSGAASTIGYTSGTTGHPKGAAQSQRAVLLNCRSTRDMHQRSEADVVVTALPAPHVYGNVAINSTFLAGGTVVLMDRFEPGRALALIGEHRATMFEGVPAMYAMMLAHDDIVGADLASLTRCTVGGQTIALSTVQEWEKRSGSPLIELWGMTELSGLGTTHWARQPTRPGSIGVALPGLELRVASLEDYSRDAPIGEPGELVARGPLVMLGYFGNDGATAEAIEEDGWLHTGDIARADSDGYYYIVDRRKDLIITAGYNIYPAEIERVLVGHSAVAMAAVGPVPDEIKGELARAYVVLRPGAQVTELDLIDHCRGHLAAYKLPRSVRFVDALPQTSTGKIMRRRLVTLDVARPQDAS